MSDRCGWQRRTVALGLALLMLTMAGLVVAADAPATRRPVFAIDSLAHAGEATRIAASADQRHLVTVALDKSLRIWDAESGRLLKRLVVPVTSPTDGALLALALSPDGRWAAVGGYTRALGKDNALVVVDLRDGSIGKAISGFTSNIWSLAWSGDGKYLAAGLGDEGAGRGVVIFDTATWRRVFADREIEGRVANLAFRDDNSLLATTHNMPRPGSVYVYRHQGEGFARQSAKSFGAKFGLRSAWSLDGRAIYVQGHGYYAADDLRELPHPVNSQRRGSGPMSTAGWRESPDGRYLVSLSSLRHERSGKAWRWPLPSGGRLEELKIPDPRINDFVVLRDGTIGYVSDRGAVAAIGPEFALRWRHAPKTASFDAHPEALRVSADENWITLAFEEGEQGREVAFQLEAPGYATVAGAAKTWRAPMTGRSGMAVLSWQGTVEASINERPLPIGQRERNLSVAVHSREDALVAGGTANIVRKIDGEGKRLWQRYLGADVVALNLLEARELVVAATADGFLHLLRWRDGVPLLAYFLEPAARRWLAVDPRGRYEAGIGAEDLAGWIVGAGSGRMADLYPLSRLRKGRLVPGLAQQVLRPQADVSAPPSKEAAASEESSGETGHPLAKVVVDKLPPTIDIVAPGFEVSTGERELAVRYRVRSDPSSPAGEARVSVRSAATATRGLKPAALKESADADGVRTVHVTLPPEDAEIQFVAENQWGPSLPATVRVRWTGSAVPASRGRLHVLAVGVSAYTQAELRLGFAAKDARDFAASVRAQAGGLYEDVSTTVLLDGEASRQGIVAALAALSHQVGPKDTTLLFLAGHGINDERGEYRFLPRDATLDTPAQSGLALREIGDSLTRLSGRTVMFIDTCHAGNAIERLRADHGAAVNELASAEKNLIVFAAATGGQSSLEDPRWGNGAFTKAILEGVGGAADLFKKGRVTYKQLDAYVADRVESLTEGRQTPVTPVLVTQPDFPLVNVKR